MPATIAFFGNRYAPLSWVFGERLIDLARRRQLNLVIVDTSTATEGRLVRRARHRMVAFAKRLLGVRHPTATLDWLRRAKAAGCMIIIPRGHSLRDAALPERLRELNVTAALVAGCDQILRQPLIAAIPRIVNYHNSRLPEHRGCDAVGWAMLCGASSVGFSFHTVESERVDAGRLLVQGQIDIDEAITPMEIDVELARAAADRLDDLVAIMLSDAPLADWPTLEGGTYHRRGEIAPYRIFDPRLTRQELRHRLRIFGSLDWPSPSRLRITGLDSTNRDPLGELAPLREVGEYRVNKGRIMVRCADGEIAIATINFLPASWFAGRLHGRILPGNEPFRVVAPQPHRVA